MSYMGKFTVRFQAIGMYGVALCSLLVTLSACSFPVQPRYQPISESSILSAPWQGYQDIQIDERTYFIFYRNYYRESWYGPVFDPGDEKWVQGAHEYVLYRAGELAKSKGALYFVILHKDDWNLVTRLAPGKSARGSFFHPGAGIVMRILRDAPVSIQPHDDRIHDVDQLLRDLQERNIGLADYQKKPGQVESIERSEKVLPRWRSVSGYGIRPVLDHREKYNQIFDPALPILTPFRPETNVTKKPTGGFEIAIWDDNSSPTFPLQVLRQCVVLAEHEGFEVFRLENWNVEEHRETTPEGGVLRVWFRTTATVTLQHEDDPDSLDPVFVVDEIRTNVMNNK